VQPGVSEECLERLRLAEREALGFVEGYVLESYCGSRIPELPIISMPPL
jgi:hypothetical protein